MGGLKSGVNGTPTFFINARRHDAAYDFDDLLAAMDGSGATRDARLTASGR